MKICGFLQNYNGVENGDLLRCLKSMCCVVDHIYVYDDGSTEDVWPLYKAYDCVVIPGRVNDFSAELLHKQALLGKIQSDHPDFKWICWFDNDAILGSLFETRKDTEEVLGQAADQEFVQIFLHNLNLWRSRCWYRVDSHFNDLWHCVWWYNTGELYYPQPRRGLHQQQYPNPYRERGVVKKLEMKDPRGQLLHYGFSDYERIVRKYLTYKQEGQTGERLDRLYREKDMHLEPVELDWFPLFDRPEEIDSEPQEMLPDHVANMETVNEYEQSKMSVL
ncbi:MAG: hypothetical protein KKD77_22925 [Gammaproteobacteria bacterium]|nr:hypothetical protein [Gammaproteobacteria bacterium]